MTDEIEVTTVEGVPTAGDVPTLGGMPMLGYGTWKLEDPAACVDAVETALEMGYRHVDTAQAYGNESEVGDAIANSHVDREEVFLATKVWIDNLAGEDVVETAYDSLEKLGTDHVDLLYVHWPSRSYDAAETLAAFDDLVDEGVTDRIGVSNFEPDQLAEACELTDAPIFAHQFECHPLLPQQHLLDACEEHDVHPVAYSPLARGSVLDVPEVADVAAKHEATPAQVSLAWLRQRGVTAIPKAASEGHIRDNWGSLAVRLDDDDMAKLSSIDRTERQVDPGFAPWN
ncbi:aldo/keto reductase [Haloparvum alkalitolerans]|uniref:aldo/keto reductase n=1 Tax=Haloparvum alkalitolerans TaxID=1042953 RepID=UPI003CF8218C